MGHSAVHRKGPDKVNGQAKMWISLLTRDPVGIAGATQTMAKPSVYQNSLQAVPFHQQLSGYKDPQDAFHRSDKSAFIRSAVML